jgi:hypothetical protein
MEKYKTTINNKNYVACCILTSLPIQTSIMKAFVIYMYIFTNMAMVKTCDQWQ